jgi:hypothetical protein
MVRVGYVARGVIYLLPGYLALRLALGIHGAAINQTDAIDYIAGGPFGRLMLVGLAIGLAGYALWGAIRAVFDPTQEGHDAKGIAKRLGFASSALAYVGLFAVTIQILSPAISHVVGQRHWTSDLLARPFGPWLFVIVGLCWIVGGGIVQISHGWSGRFIQDLDMSRVSAAERAWVITLGRFGIVARGIVFVLIGMLLIGAALKRDALEAKGMDGALMALAHQPFGRALLAAVALGLVVFGLFSILCARWIRVRLPDHGSTSVSHSLSA